MIKASISGLETISRIGNSLSDIKPVNLLIGDPDHLPPISIRQIAREVLQSRRHYGYTDQQGDSGLRDVLAELVVQEGFTNVDRDNIFVSSGSKPITFGLLSKYVKPGKNVVLMSPHYPPYVNQIKALNGNVEFADSIDELETLLQNQHTTAVIIVTPNNPDGSITNNADLGKIIEGARRDQLIVLDEAYKDFAYDREFTSAGSYVDIESPGNVAIVRTFSKSLAICGWRIGYAITSKDMAKELKKHQSTVLNPPNSIFQETIRRGILDIPEEYYELNRERYRSRIDILVSNLKSHGINATMPNGAFYLFLELPSEHTGPAKRFPNGTNFAADLARKTGVLVWPGRDYGTDNAIRISLAKVDDQKLLYVAQCISQTLTGE